MAGESVTPVHDVDDIHMIVKRKNRNDEKRVEDDTISVSVGDYHSADDGRRNRSNKQMHDAGNRTPLGYGTRAQSPRSPDMQFLEPMTSAFRPIAMRETPLHSRAASRRSDYSHVPSQISGRTPVNLDWLGSVMHKVVDDASNMRHQLTDQTLRSVHNAASKHAEAEILRKEKNGLSNVLKLKCVSLKNFRRTKQRCLKPI